MKRPWLPLVKLSLNTSSIFSLLVLAACGGAPYDITKSLDRAEMQIDIRNSLTKQDCQTAITLASKLYSSSYVDNDIRLLFASSHGCNIGIVLYTLLDELTKSTFSSQDEIFKALVRLFPSTTDDTKLQSAWLAQDALLSSLQSGAVVGTVDEFNPGASSVGGGVDPTTNIPYNLASVYARDRTLDSNAYLVFISMAVVGNSLNRYGYASGQSPAALSYAQGQDLTWTTAALVQADTSGAACGLVSGLLNMLDSIDAISGLLSGGSSSSLSSISTNLTSAVTQAGTFNCNTIDGYSTSQCSAAAIRLRDRASCSESGQIASFAAGVIQGINLGWL